MFEELNRMSTLPYFGRGHEYAPIGPPVPAIIASRLELSCCELSSYREDRSACRRENDEV